MHLTECKLYNFGVRNNALKVHAVEGFQVLHAAHGAGHTCTGDTPRADIPAREPWRAVPRRDIPEGKKGRECIDGGPVAELHMIVVLLCPRLPQINMQTALEGYPGN